MMLVISLDFSVVKEGENRLRLSSSSTGDIQYTVVSCFPGTMARNVEVLLNTCDSDVCEAGMHHPRSTLLPAVADAIIRRRTTQHGCEVNNPATTLPKTKETACCL